MTLILVILLVFVVLGGGYGWRAGYYGPGVGYGNPLGLILLVLLVLVILSLFAGPRYGWWGWW